MEDAIARSSDVAVSDGELLAQLERNIPLLADLTHADVLLYVAGNQPNTAVVVAHGEPHTVSSVYPARQVGRQVERKNEPGLFQVLDGIEPRGEQACLMVRRYQTIQEWLPVCNKDGQVVAALCIESNCLEFDRKRQKNLLFRQTLNRIIHSALRGRLAGAEELTPLRAFPGIMIADREGRIEYVNSVAENMYRKAGYAESLVGHSIPELMTQEQIFFEAMQRDRCMETEVEEHGMIWIKKVLPIHRDDAATGYPIAGPSGGMVITHDVTEERQREKALRIKTAMIQEIHHRVKNNLQTIAALLRMQARRSESTELAQMIQESVNRILSIAVVHESLSQGDGNVINIREVSQRIITEVIRGILDPSKQIAINLEGNNLFLPAQQATSCALIINELLQNAVEHGFQNRTLGQVTVKLMDLGSEVVVEIADNGEGLPQTIDVSGKGHLGLQIISTLVKEDLKGRFEMVNENGVKARVTIPKRSTSSQNSEAKGCG